MSKVLSRSFVYMALALGVKLLVARYVLFGAWDLAGFAIGEAVFVAFLVGVLDARRSPTWKGLVWVDGVLSVLLVAAMAYHAQFDRVPSLQVLGWVSELRGVGGSVVALLRPHYALLFASLPAWWVASRLRPDFVEPLLGPGVRRVLLRVAVLGIVVNIAVGLVRPSPDFSRVARERGIVNAEIIDALQRAFQRRIPVDAEDTAAIQESVDHLAGYPGEPVRSRPAGEARGRDVIVILVESLQGIAVDREVGGHKVTPNIDALAAEGLYFPNTYAQVSAGNTADCEFMLNTSLYPLESKPVSIEYGGKSIPSLPKRLAAAGYVTATFHPNTVTYWNRDELYPALGFKEVYEQEFFGGEDIAGIGASDEVLFDKALPVLAEKHRRGVRYYATFVTLTGHHPFELPADKRRLELPAEMRGTLVGDYLVSMNYTDAAIGEFIGGLKREGLYEDSIIVIVGDHFGLQNAQMTQKELSLVEEMLGRPYNDADRLNVPLVIAAPGTGDTGVSERVCGQIDVAPTLSAMLGLPPEGTVHFGRDLLADAPALLGIRYYEPVGTYIDDERIVMPSGGGETRVFDSRSRAPLSGKPPVGAKSKMERISKLQLLSDAYLDALPRR
ncbi:MAG: hypothetical protein C0418_06480 [Coriobacteriaceae bacterium]|nr:hypothetical protein [Coriobacteriaceae bacterium]